MTVAYNIAHTGFTDTLNSLSFEGALNDVPVFHILLANLSLICGISVVTATQYTVRLIIIFILANIFFITRRLFSKEAAVLAVIMLAFFVPSMYIIYNEGTYLDLFSAGYLLPMAIYFLHEFFQASKFSLRYLILSIIFLSAVILTHPLSTIGLGFILFVLHIFLFANSISQKKYALFKRILLIDLILIIDVALAWNYYFSALAFKFVNLFQLIFASSFNVQSASQSLNYLPPSLGLSDVPGWHNYVEFIPLFCLVCALIGLIVLWRNKNNSTISKFIITSWVSGLFIASQLAFTQLPIRFARHLYLPAVIIAGIGLYAFIKLIKPHRYIYNIGTSLLVLFLIFNMHGFVKTVNNYNDMVRLQEPDRQAIAWLQKNTPQDTIMLGTPKVANAEWGSFITLLTNRQMIGCEDDGIIEKDDLSCSSIFDPNSEEVKKFITRNNISYIYGGKPFIGPFLWKNYINWSYYKVLEEVNWLEKVYDYRDSSGRVVIYKINKEKLINI